MCVSLKMCVSVCTFLALISLGSAPVSIMKTRSGSSPSTDIVVTGETDNFFGFITATLRSLSSVPSPESLSRPPDVFCSGPLEIRPLAASILNNCSVNYCIDVCDILQFRVLYSLYILIIIALFEVPFVSYTCRFTVPII